MYCANCLVMDCIESSFCMLIAAILLTLLFAVEGTLAIVGFGCSFPLGFRFGVSCEALGVAVEFFELSGINRSGLRRAAFPSA